MSKSRGTAPHHSTSRKAPALMNALAPIFDLDPCQYQSLVTGWLREEVEHEHSPVKTLAEIARAPVATAKHWYANEAAPNGVYMSRLRACFPAFNAHMRRLEGMRTDMDPQFTNALNTMFMHYLRTDESGVFAKEMYDRFFKKDAAA